MPYNPSQFADKYLLAVEQAIKEKPSGGLNGFEKEWNLLDEDLRPLHTVGAGPSQRSFVDYLRAECIPLWQIIPSALGELMGTRIPRSRTRVMHAMLQMDKIDIQALKRSYHG